MVTLHSAASDRDLHCLQRQDISGFSSTKVKQRVHAISGPEMTVLHLKER